MKIELCDKKNCTACGLCVRICPKGAITLLKDKLECFYPEIHYDKCVGCGACVKNCPTNVIDRNDLKYVYAAWSNNEENRFMGASGGIASELYLWCIDNGWSAYGVAYDYNNGARFIKVLSKQDVDAVRNSKYVSINGLLPFEEIISDMKSYKGVLFIGLPCQVAAVKQYVKSKGIKDDNLLTVDLICHGIAPHEYFQQHVAHIAKKRNVNKVFFRNPNRLTSNFYLSLYCGDKEIYAKKANQDDAYQLGYHKALIYRENCYSCRWATADRGGDLTIGDFSGLGKVKPIQYRNINVNCLMVNSDQGKRIVDELIDTKKISVDSRPVEEALKYEKQLSGPSHKHSRRAEFIKAYETTSNFDKSAKRALKKEISKYRLYKFSGIMAISTAFRKLVSPQLKTKLKKVIKK